MKTYMATNSSCSDRLLHEARHTDFLVGGSPGHIRQVDSCSPTTGLSFTPQNPSSLVCATVQTYTPHDPTSSTRYHSIPPGTFPFTYPSPPLTGPAFNIVPLPTLDTQNDSLTFTDLSCIGTHGEFDFDKIMPHNGSHGREPLSPPPTFQLSTLALPHLEADASSPMDQLSSGPARRAEDGDGSSRWTSSNVSAQAGSSTLLTPISPLDRNFQSYSSLSSTSTSSCGPTREDSGFAEFLPKRQHSGHDEFCGAECPSSYSMVGIEPEPTVLWAPHSPMSVSNLLPGDELDSDDYMHWSVAEQQLDDGGHELDFVAPDSPRPGLLSLDLPELDDFVPASRAFGLQSHDDNRIGRPPLHPLDIPAHEFAWHQHAASTDKAMDLDTPPPHSPRPFSLHLPALDPFSDSNYDFDPASDTSLADTVMPPDEDDLPPIPPSSPSRRAIYALPGETDDETCHDLALFDDTPYPPDSDSDPMIASSSQPPDSSFGLGLFLPPSAIDPPIARSPSPEEDETSPDSLAPVFNFSDDPEVIAQLTAECEGLRALRRRAVAAEHAARMAEAELGERVTSATEALLPPLHVPHGDAEKRTRKRELKAALDARAEARRVRKREKQRAREAGTLLELKMRDAERGARGVAQLVAGMMLRRRETFRPLAGRARARPYVPSALYSVVTPEEALRLSALDGVQELLLDTGLDVAVQ